MRSSRTLFAATLLVSAGAAYGAKEVRLPATTKQALPNGGVMVLSPNSDVPVTTVRILFRGGGEADPQDKTGLSSVVAEMLRRGTATRSAEQIAEQLDFLGANFSGGADNQATTFTLDFMSKDAEAALAILKDVLTQPAFPEAELKKVLAQRIDSVKSIKDNPGAAVNVYFRPFFFPPGHPYARTTDERSLANITRDDVVNFYRQNFVGRNLIAAAAGAFDGVKFGAQLSAALAPLPAGTQFVWPAAPALRKFDSARLLLVDKPDATQTYFLIAQPGIERTSPDRIPLRLVNTLFGGRFTSMLNDALRVNSGLTYGANSQVQEDRLTGSLFISTYTRTDTTEKAIDMALDILRQLNQNGINAEQLASAKAYTKGLYPTRQLETGPQVADILSELELYGLNKGEVDDLFPRIDAVTLERANAVAKKYYRLDNLQLCLVGNAAKIQEAVKKYAPKMRVITMKEPGFVVPEF